MKNLMAATFALLLSASVSEAQKPEILTKPPMIPEGTFPDEIDRQDLANLDGLEVEYTYDSGRAYRLKFYDDRVSFSQLDTPAPTLTVPYLARPIKEDSYLVHWLVPGRIGHVALILDLDQKAIFASALMPGKMEMFQSGVISSVERP